MQSGASTYDNDKITFLQRIIRLYNTFENTNFNDATHLELTNQKINEQNLPLKANPAVPTKTYQIDTDQANQYISELVSLPHQNTARKIIDNCITHISYNEFAKCVEQALYQFRLHCITHNIDLQNASVMIEQGHSSEWVASLAMKYLQDLPGAYDLYDDMKKSRSFNFSAISEPNHTLIIFDDWSISGRQLSTVFTQIAQAKKESRQEFKLNIVAVIPLMTEAAYQETSQLSNKYKDFFKDINIQIINPTLVSSLYDILGFLTEEEITHFNEIFDFPPKAHLSEDNLPDYTGKVLAFSDWKVLDFASMPVNFTEGRLPWKLTAHNGKRYDEIPSGANHHRFIPEVPSPYKNSGRWGRF